MCDCIILYSTITTIQSGFFTILSKCVIQESFGFNPEPYFLSIKKNRFKYNNLSDTYKIVIVIVIVRL